MDYERVVVFGAHPDDEITMAAAIAKMADLGVEVTVAIYTDGCEGYPDPNMADTIVERRADEQRACDEVLGIARRVRFGRPDMALMNDKETFLDTIRLIREVRPDAIFTHGPYDNHRDHRNTHAISVEARWQAGQPVAARLGAPWVTPYLYYYKAVHDPLPRIEWDVTGYAHKRLEALATQESQHILFGRTKQSFLDEASRIQAERPRAYLTFWIAENECWQEVPPRRVRGDGG
ncbi:MAG: PIG-L deacetylase family protein [Candidatus Zipacnadales bacterium]